MDKEMIVTLRINYDDDTYDHPARWDWVELTDLQAGCVAVLDAYPSEDAPAPAPTAREIAAHLDQGGEVEWFDPLGGVWCHEHWPAATWRTAADLDVVQGGYRLVPLPANA